MRPTFIISIAAVLTLQAAAMAADASLKITEDASTVSILAGDQPVLQYQRTANPRKPYIKTLFTPAGVNILRDSPHDHVHHHALMFAIGVDGVDFWSEHDAGGRQQPRSLGDVRVTAADGVSRAGFTQQLDWIAPDSDKKLAEGRTIEVCRIKDSPVTLVTWQSVLQPPAGKDAVTLGGSHYFGLGIRFVESMDRLGKHFQADRKAGPVVRGDERLTPTRWSAYTAPIDGKPVTVAMFDHPGNVRHPAQFFTMLNPFSYVSATLNLSKEPLKLQAGKPLVLRYGVAVWDGEVDAAAVEEVYRQWIK